ncbi:MULTISPECIES: hypothetical protein [Vibrio]|uniref:hypothetical protein n=1 Tax=Vibrio TaxID=662 RepID=UPI0020750F36|nr:MULTISPECIES: hypothetical protein [Vibrio]USD35554.1 hypothetical protein J8Z27_22340 [Vibrio sp. SCSIO 43186]USD72678.1 hypothetical protein J4N41_22355 [Vibrio sp. SCSIO 43139]USD98892.1 hypothetical protein CTT30_22685 [Vibrio coralliilyticus]
MNEQNIFINSVKPISDTEQLFTLVNATDPSALPHTHLYYYSEREDYPKLLVTGNAMYDSIAYSSHQYVYIAGEHGHVITNCPGFQSRFPKRQDLTCYEPDISSVYSLERVADSRVCLAIGFDDSNTVIFCTKSGQALIYIDGKLEHDLKISKDPISYCVDKSGNIYVGTEEGRVWLLAGKDEPEEVEMPKAIINGMAESPEGELYVVSYNGYIAKKSINDRSYAFLDAPCLAYTDICFVNDAIYISTHGGLFSAKDVDGVVQLIELRNTFSALSLSTFGNKLYLTSDTPKEHPFYVEATTSDLIDRLEKCTAISVPYSTE